MRFGAARAAGAATGWTQTANQRNAGRPAGTRLLLGSSVGWLGISMVADGVPAMLLPYRLTTAGGDAAALGLVTLVAIALAAFVQPYAGRWSDVHGRFPVMTLGVLVTGAGLAVIAAPLPPGVAIAGAVLALVGASVAQAGQQALLPDVVGGERRGLASGAKGAFDVGGALLAFVLLAALLAGGELAMSALVLFGALAAGAAAAYVLLRGARRGAAQRQPPSPSRAIWLSRREHAPLIELLVARFIFLLGVYAVGRFLMLFVADRWSLGAEAAAGLTGLVLAVLAGVTVLSSLPAGWLADRVGRRRPMIVGGLLSAAGIGLLPAAPGVEALIVGGTLLAVGTALFGAASWARLADLVAESDSGRLLGVAHLATAGAAAIAGVFGVLIEAGEGVAPQLGYGVSFILAAICALVGGVLGGYPRDASRPTSRIQAMDQTRGAK